MKPCENCGETSFTEKLTGNIKAALSRVTMPNAEVPNLKHVEGAGLPVRVFVCDHCKTIRMLWIDV